MTTTDLVPLGTPSTVPADLDQRLRMLALLADAGALPAAYRRRPADLLLVSLIADSLDVPLAAAIQSVYVVDGRPSLASSLVASLVRRAGHRLRTTTGIADDGTPVVTATLVRADDPDWTATATWTMERATLAGLAGKDNWKRYPAQMLRARAVAEVVREAAPEVLSGLYAAEELDGPVAGVVERDDATAPDDAAAVDADVVDDRAPVGRARTTPGGQPYPPSDRQMTAMNARMRSAGVRDVIHRGWVVAAVLDLPGHVSSLRSLTHAQASAFLDRTGDRAALASVVAGTAALGVPDDDQDAADQVTADQVGDADADPDTVMDAVVVDADGVVVDDADPDTDQDADAVDDADAFAGGPVWPDVPDQLRTPRGDA